MNREAGGSGSGLLGDTRGPRLARHEGDCFVRRLGRGGRIGSRAEHSLGNNESTPGNGGGFRSVLASPLRLRVGAMMLEQNDEWSLNRRYMQLEGLQSLSDTVPTRLSAVAR